MAQEKEEFFYGFRQELLAGAEANGNFLLSEFMESVANELIETGFTDGFEFCHYRAQRGMRTDGYWFNDDGILELFITDFDNRTELTSLSKTEVAVLFKRLLNFLDAAINKNLANELEITSPEYGLARQISDRIGTVHKINLYILSERVLSEKIQELPDSMINGIPVSHHIWDISRIYRQRSSKSHKELLNLDFVQMFGKGVNALAAHLAAENYKSYLVVIPAEILASLYGKFGARLLEQNVRTFLQARGAVNKGIRETILKEPGMFFAYNNGITATAQSVDTDQTPDGLVITRIVDLQIVNGGQTTASLFHAQRKDRADLSNIFVQMKLSVIDSHQSDWVVPKISEFANTQNKVSAADFFSNHPFHIRMEEFSRRLWAPAQRGAQRETRWFYERTRGQYADAQTKLSIADQRKFKAENPKLQMFTKTDLAKYENVWDDHPKWVNLGSQKNFKQYAERIGREWENSSDGFNEFYFKRAVARAIIFRNTERIVSTQSWYNGGYRANIVAYTIALISEFAKQKKRVFNFIDVWNDQEVDMIFERTISAVAKLVNEDITKPPVGISNISEWCKREACWSRLKEKVNLIPREISSQFESQLISLEENSEESKAAKDLQKIDNGIDAQKAVLKIKTSEWLHIKQQLKSSNLLTPKEESLIDVALQIPNRFPSEKQCILLLGILRKVN